MCRVKMLSNLHSTLSNKSFPEEVNCPVETTKYPTGCYYISDTTRADQLKTWEEAKVFCTHLVDGATLLIVDTFEDSVSRYTMQCTIADIHKCGLRSHICSS